MEKKECLKNITFCIPVRIESEYRMRNLIALIEYIDMHFETNFIILEADKVSKFEVTSFNLDTNCRIHYLFIEDIDPVFHRSRYINEMLDMTGTQYAAIWDTDAIASVKQISEAYSSLQNDDVAMAFPFSGEFYGLDNTMSDIFVNSIDIKKIDNLFIAKNIMYGFYAVGGAFMVNIKKYREAGGENENFYGWGLDDQERVIRLQILGEQIKRVQGPLYHLFHTRGHNSMISSKENAIRVKSEFCKICSMNKIELVSYINSWDWNKK